MLTEETIKKTRFFRGVDEKIYLVVEVRNVNLATLIDTIEGGESRLLLDDDEVCHQFFPVLGNFEALGPEKEPAEIPEPSLTMKVDSAISRAGHKKPVTVETGTKSRLPGQRKRIDSSSEFPGVMRADNYRDGRPRFEAGYMDKKTRKRVYIGRSDSEFLAAAMYQEHIGDKQEAERLRALVKEQQELNPDRPLDGMARHEAKRTGKTIYVCKKCGLEYQSKGTCAGCGNDDMRKVKA